MKHELWVDPEGLDTFCLSGPKGNAARELLPAGSTLEWTVEAKSHFEAMTRYYEYQRYGTYESEHHFLDNKLYEAENDT
jgi:tRNA(Glu) U13 pseudouridine synthase TruD